MNKDHKDINETEGRDLDEYVPEDDAIIGKAFRGSLVVIVGLLAVGGLLFFLFNRPEEQAPEVAIDSVAPVEVSEPEELTPPDVPFTDITADAGIDFVHVNGAEGEKLLPETMGSGVAFFDYDNDGDQDLLLVNSMPWPHSKEAATAATTRLYRNDGTGQFEDVSAATGIDVRLYATGVAIGDYDGDGRSDVFLAAVGKNRLLRNLGDGFEDATATAGVAGAEDSWSSSAGFFDADGDGDLDLFVGNYVRWSRNIDLELDYRLTGVGRAYGPPVNYQGTFSYFYTNNGDGTFTDVSAESGIQVQNEATGVPVGKALGLAPLDVDRDGLMDVVVANDTVQNFFFHNQGGGVFEEMAEFYGVAYGRAGEATGAMGIDAGYYRNDGELGFVIGNFANEMTSLYLSQGDPTLYTDEAIGEGVGAPSRTFLSFGVLFLDYDLDGRLDILETNGHLENEIDTVDPSQSYEQSSQLFWNAGLESRQSFLEVPEEQLGGLATPIVGRSSAYADIDADGDLDVVLTQVGQRPLLLRNDQALGHHWLRVRLMDHAPNVEAIGARLELQADGMTRVRTVMPTRGYQSQSELVVTFGLGTSTQIDGLTVFWPDGTEQSVTVEAVDHLLTITRE